MSAGLVNALAWRGAALALTVLTALGCGQADPQPAAEATGAELRAWAQDRLQAHDLRAATVGFRRALQRDSLDAAALAGLATIYELQNRADPADRYRRRAFHIHYDRGVRHIEAGRMDSARGDLAAALDVMPRHPMAHLRLGELNRAEGHLDSAIVHFENAVAANPRYAASLIALGDAYRAAGRAAAAVEAYRRAIAVNVNAVEAYAALGEIFSGRGDWVAAAAQYEKVLLIDPQSATARRGLERARNRLRGR